MTVFVPRLTEPNWSEPYWIKTTHGGYNRCIVIDSNTGLCVPNCTGWVYGRFMEAGAVSSCNLSVGDGADFYTEADGYQRGSEPEVGGILCYTGGQYGYGHVAFVEEKASDGTWVRCSESDYGGSKFYLNYRYRSLGWVNQGSTTVYQGCIYNPFITIGSGQLKLWMVKALLRRRKNNEHKRTVLF